MTGRVVGGTIDYVLDGLIEYLELERELGTRTVEIDRALLANNCSQVSAAAQGAVSCGQGVPALPERTVRVQSADAERTPRLQPVQSPAPVPTPPQPATRNPQPETRNLNPQPQPQPSTSKHHFVFLHHAALSPKAVEMMAKIIPAMGETAESAPILFTGPLPTTRICVVLGALALKKWFPGKKGAPGQWLHLDDGHDVLITYSPEYFLRFETITPAVKKMKESMWLSLKGLKQRMRIV